MIEKDEIEIEIVKEEIRTIVKKIKSKGGHGGAWKVAYADFVTGMMALFIVLWLTSSQSSQIKEVVGQYFTNPRAFNVMDVKKSNALGEGVLAQKGKKSVDEVIKGLDKEKKGLTKALKQFKTIKNDAMVNVTADGIEIELSDTDTDTDKIIFFKAGSAEITEEAKAKIIAAFSNIPKIEYPIIIEGHTDATPTGKENYTNWELSGDRANAIRRLIEEMNVGKVIEVRAYGASRLLRSDLPYDPSNRRVNFIIQMSDKEKEMDEEKNRESTQDTQKHKQE